MPAAADWKPVTILRHSYFWVGIEPKETDQGRVTTGDYLLCEYIIPEKVRFKYPIVLLHGGGQSIVYHGMMERPGWVNGLLQDGFMVYIVERPGHGRTGYRIDTFGPPPPPTPFEAYVGENGMLQAARREGSQWPGNGEWDDPATFQLMGQVTPAPPPLGAQVEDLCRKRGIELLEKIGPSVLLAASAGSIFAWTVADARPDLVKGIVCVEGIPPTSLQTPLHFDPPVKDVGELALKDDWSKSLDLIERFYSSLQAEPARQLPHLAQVPIAYVHGDETIDPRFQRMVVTATDFLRQAGCSVDLISLTQEGIFGNTHFMPLEINNLEVLNVLTRWIRIRIS